jgi:hypothetical protein
MKKVIGISIIALISGLTSVNAQSTADKVGNDVKNGAKKVGNKTAELSSKGAHRVTDKVYKDKVGPNGETIYIDGHNRYFWIDDKGHRQFVNEDQLRDKDPNDMNTTQKVGKDVKTGAKKVGNKTAELTSKGAHRIKDKVYKDKVGPNGETIYIDSHNRYFWIDNKGHRQFIEENQLRDKQ